MSKRKQAFLFALGLLPVTLLGQWFTLRYLMELYPPEMLDALAGQMGSLNAAMAAGLLQGAVTVTAAAFFGRLLAEKLGLWHGLRPEKRALKPVLLWSTAAGILFSLDWWTFGAVIPGVREATLSGMTVRGILSSVLYGGVAEEVLLRLFFQSLVSFLLWKLLFRRKKTAPAGALIAGNVLAALLFAAGHLPATISAFGKLTPLLVLRCFLFNGGFGLLFGRLYRKYGFPYACLGHTLCHVVSKLIWFLFL